MLENIDYLLTYHNNIDIGTAWIQISGIGYYCETVERYFTISNKDISHNTVAYFRKISKDVEVREEFTFDYSLDSCLENSATEYNPDLACMLSALVASAYQKDTITDSLRNLGFKTETKDFHHYDENYTDDKTAFALVTKNMEDGTTLISVIIRGSYGDILDFTGDWKSNANFKNMGKGLHEGFAAAAKDISEELDKFKIEQNRCAIACQGCGIAIFCFM